MTPGFVVSLALLFGGVALLIELLVWKGNNQVLLLSDVLAGTPPASGTSPSLSVIVTAKDEAADIEETVRRLLGQDHPDIELVVVNDRSTDRTGAILDRLSGEFAGQSHRLTVIHNAVLPKGWIGKCHACHLGATSARGSWILFVDGDVTIADATLLRRILDVVVGQKIDHLALIPDMRPMSLMKEALSSMFARAFLLAARAFEMDRDLPRGGAGVGAFNLVRRASYDRVGGHVPLRMDTGDDFKLGRLLKQSGARQRIWYGLDLVRCIWQPGAVDVLKGLEKNFFGGFDYSFASLTVASFGDMAILLVPILAPLWALWAGYDAGSVVLAAAPIVLQHLAFGVQFLQRGRQLGLHLAVIPLRTVAGLMLWVAAWNSALRITAGGGVRWRDTFYPLGELRAGILRDRDIRKLLKP